MNGNFYLATSSPSTFATSSQTSALSIVTGGITGLIGLGTSTPYANLSVNTSPGLDAFAVGSSTGTYLRVTSLGTTTALRFDVTGTATSSFNAGIAVTGSGCFALNGACIGNVTGAGAASGANGLVQFSNGSGVNLSDTDFFWDNTNKRLGIGTTTPWGMMSVNPNALGAGVPSFVIGSSTATSLIVTNGGQVGIGRESVTALNALKLEVVGTTNGSTAGIWHTAQVAIHDDRNQATGVGGGLVFNGEYIDSDTSVATFAGIRGSKNNSTSANTSGDLELYSRAGNIKFFSTMASAIGSNTETMRINSSGNVGIGTTTPQWLLNPFSATAPQLALSSGAGNGQWAFRNVTGNLYLATTSADGTATSTLAAITINGTNGYVGIGSTTPGAFFSINPTATAISQFMIGTTTHTSFMIDTNGSVLIGTTTATTTRLSVDSRGASGTSVVAFSGSAAVCFMKVNAGAITCSSDARLKKDISTLSPALSTVLALHPVNYLWNPDPENTAPHVGFIAQEVQAIIPDLVAPDDYGMLGLNYSGFAPYLVSAIQSQQGIIDALVGTTTLADISATSTNSQAITDKFFQNIFARLVQWLADATNGIGKLFAGEVHTKELCVSDDTGETCVTKSQLDALIANAYAAPDPPAPEPPPEDPSADGPPADTEPPVITIYGNNPAEINVGDTYADLGASVTDNVDQNLGIYIFIGGTEVQTIALDTSTSTTYSIIYRATDTAGNTGEATRTVNVTTPEPPPEPPPTP
jgi:hypothetical protein